MKFFAYFIIFLNLKMFAVETQEFSSPELQSSMHNHFTQKTIGLIGGASWESTALYYQLINQKVGKQLGGLNSAKLLLYSINYDPIISLELENNWEEIGIQLGTAARSLEEAGADFIALSCNTLHKVAPQITDSLSVPFLHIAESAGKALRSRGVKRVGLLGTEFTMKDGFYSSNLEENFGLEVLTPNPSDSQIIDEIIYQELCLGKIEAYSKSKISEIIHTLRNEGAEAILLGCTELGLLVKQEDFQIPIFDTTILHIQDIFEHSLSSLSAQKED
ncbi:MAG: aspartate/glutamate racemase family protein [Candidatus Algichlamydia australiensis]|nr:aspartate/glutamate racemase family protein [Chlamydiales bacterium]